MKSARIRSLSGPYFFRIRTEYGEIQSVSLIQSKCGKIQTRKTQKTGTFHGLGIFFARDESISAKYLLNEFAILSSPVFILTETLRGNFDLILLCFVLSITLLVKKKSVKSD